METSRERQGRERTYQFIQRTLSVNEARDNMGQADEERNDAGNDK